MSEKSASIGIQLKTDKAEGDYYFPINTFQVRDLIGKMLTHVEAMGLTPSAEKANKDLIRQTLWRWFSDVRENSITSYRGCIAPIEVLRDPTNMTERKYVWLNDSGTSVVSVNV